MASDYSRRRAHLLAALGLAVLFTVGAPSGCTGNPQGIENPDAAAVDLNPLDGGTADGGTADGGAADAGAPVAERPDAGCWTGEHCRSGLCLGSLDCADCESDSECAAGRVCGTGKCAPPCDAGAGCDGGTCCQGRCVDTRRDIDHCGGCAVACGRAEFCNGQGCLRTALMNLCANPLATVLLDNYPPDNDAGVEMGAALAAGCVPPPTLRQVEATGGAIQPGSGRPRVGGSELLVVGGGAFGQRLVDYVESQGIAPVYDSSNLLFQSMSTRDGGVLFSVDRATVTASHDYFVVELVREPGNGSLALVVYGFYVSGTRAGSWYFSKRVLPGRSSLTGSWYVFEWTDLDGDLHPGVADTFRLIASGGP